MVGVVEGEDVAAADVRVALDHHLDRLAHGAEVHGHVRRVGDQAAVGVEDRAGEIEPLLDVDRVRGGLQPHPHLLGYRHEQVVEDLQHDRVRFGADFRAARAGCHARHEQVAAAGHDGPPARLEHRGGELLGDDGRAVDGVPGPQPGPREQVHVGPGPAGEHADARRAVRPLVVFRIRTGRVVTVLVFLLRPASLNRNSLDRNGFHDDGLVAHEEGEAAGVFGLEGGGHVRQRAGSDDDRGVGALVAQVRPVRGGDPAGVPALSFHLRPGVVFQRAGDLRQPGQEITGERLLHGLLAHGDDVGQPDSVRGQHAGQRVDEDPGHAQRVGDRAGVLPARAAEHVEQVLGHVVAPLHRDLLDRVGHVGHGDLDEAGRDLLRAAGVAGGLGDPITQFRKFRFRNIRVQGLVAARTEDVREIVRLDPAEQDVGVGDGERAAAPVAGRPGIGPGRVGPGPVPAAVEVQDRAAARGHGVDGQHRRPHPHPGDLRLVLALEFPGEMGHVGGGAAHVEADDLAEAGLGRGPGHADDAAGRA